MITAGVFERATGDGNPQFIIKGGVALELRLRDRARATKDIDVVSHDQDAALARTLERAMTGDPLSGVLLSTQARPAGPRQWRREHGIRRELSRWNLGEHHHRYRASRTGRVRGRMAAGDSPHRGIRGHRSRRAPVPASPSAHRAETPWHDVATPLALRHSKCYRLGSLPHLKCYQRPELHHVAPSPAEVSMGMNVMHTARAEPAAFGGRLTFLFCRLQPGQERTGRCLR